MEEEPAGEGSNNRLAVVPWVGREAAANWIHRTELISSQVAVEEPMEAESVSMELVEEGDRGQKTKNNRISQGSGDGEFNSQWQQQYCMTPQFGPNPTTTTTTTTPVTSLEGI